MENGIQAREHWLGVNQTHFGVRPCPDPRLWQERTSYHDHHDQESYPKSIPSWGYDKIRSHHDLKDNQKVGTVSLTFLSLKFLETVRWDSSSSLTGREVPAQTRTWSLPTHLSTWCRTTSLSDLPCTAWSSLTGSSRSHTPPWGCSSRRQLSTR